MQYSLVLQIKSLKAAKTISALNKSSSAVSVVCVTDLISPVYFNLSTLNLTFPDEFFPCLSWARRKSENKTERSSDTFINMMNCFWTGHLVLLRTRKVWFMIASEFTVKKQHWGNYQHLTISVRQINDHITRGAHPDPAELRLLTGCFETLINLWHVMS